MSRLSSKLRESRHLLLGLFVLALTLHPHGEEAPARVLFNGAFEADGFTEWHDVQSLPARVGLSSNAVFRGGQAARFEVRNGDVEPRTGSERSEVSGPTFHAGQDLYIRDAIRTPYGNTYSAPWQIVQQLHEEDWDGSPGLAIFLDNRRSLKLAAGDSSRTYWRSGRLRPERWYDLTYRVKLSRNPRAGFVEVWFDGVKQKLLNGRGRAYGQTTQAPRAYIKAGIYRSRASTGISVVEHDAIAIGTSRAAVTAAP
jgi:hypothetical protein